MAEGREWTPDRQLFIQPMFWCAEPKTDAPTAPFVSFLRGPLTTKPNTSRSILSLCCIRRELEEFRALFPILASIVTRMLTYYWGVE